MKQTIVFNDNLRKSFACINGSFKRKASRIFIFCNFFAGDQELQKILQRCCQIGRIAAGIAKCEAKTPIQGIAPEYQSFCLTAIELCCTNIGRYGISLNGLLNINMQFVLIYFQL